MFQLVHQRQGVGLDNPTPRLCSNLGASDGWMAISEKYGSEGDSVGDYQKWLTFLSSRTALQFLLQLPVFLPCMKDDTPSPPCCRVRKWDEFLI